MPKQDTLVVPNIQIDPGLVQFLKTDGEGRLVAQLVNVSTSGGNLELNNGITAKIEFTADKPFRVGGQVYFDAQGKAIGFEPAVAAKAPKPSGGSGSMARRPNL